MNHCAGRLPRIAALALIGFLLAGGLHGCSSSAYTAAANQIPDEPAEALYNQGMAALQARNVGDATRFFEEVEKQHPYSAIAPQAEIMDAYAYYRGNRYDEAITAIDHFLDLHPGNKDAAYAYYLKALCYYEQIADVRRDQKMTQDALAALQEVVDRFPGTAYARDAVLKIDLARDHLAGKEMDIGRWYENQQEWLAAINRFRTVVEKYQTTSHVPEALERLTECYAVLGYNYPGSSWYQASYELLKAKNLKPEEKSGSWLTDVF